MGDTFIIIDVPCRSLRKVSVLFHRSARVRLARSRPTLRKHYAEWLPDEERDDELRLLAEAADPGLLDRKLAPFGKNREENRMRGGDLNPQKPKPMKLCKYENLLTIQ